MKKKIETRADIEEMVTRFYDRVKKDDRLGPLFNDVYKVNWADHLPLMFDFWENTLFYTGNYQGNPMLVHQNLHQQAPLREEDFERWIALFYAVLDEEYEGEKADLARQRAASISTILKLRLLHDHK